MRREIRDRGRERRVLKLQKKLNKQQSKLSSKTETPDSD
jgi:hypothetical protein